MKTVKDGLDGGGKEKYPTDFSPQTQTPGLTDADSDPPREVFRLVLSSGKDVEAAGWSGTQNSAENDGERLLNGSLVPRLQSTEPPPSTDGPPPSAPEPGVPSLFC
ncbi:hypothetical protein FQA47_010246 [Oryzias melastigma]|uniref:Uncharacterized protein n=1 Tax=Oryzias melastigma TaxID=30732 RepID=A0A834FJ13_ORYME|nr:hypothetical protein FQA47_010246 [Oryzias melastigma]